MIICEKHHNATATFTYDGQGRRVKETVNGSLSKIWIWNGNSIAEERSANGTTTKRFFSQGEQVNGTAYYYTRDHLGSIREMTDTSGNIVAQYRYDSYGRKTKTSGSIDSDFDYTGHYYHAASGLNLTLYRAYDPDTARWQSRDPLENAERKQGPNLYAYVKNEPINKVDVLGLEDQCTDCKGNPKQGNFVAAKCCTPSSEMSNKATNPYPSSYTYMGVSASRMFSETDGDNGWSNAVRECLDCMYKHGADPTFAHAFCYVDAAILHPTSFIKGFGDAVGTAVGISMGY